MDLTLYAWAGFIGLVLVLLALDLGVFHRKDHAIGFREALKWSAVWISVGVGFTGVIYLLYQKQWLGLGGELTGSEAALEYISGYLIEKSLSVDNIFVIALVFAQFQVPPKYQHRVLFWGILGALIFRGVMIGVGLAVLERFEWMIYVFGGFLILTAIKMLVSKDDEPDPGNSRLVRLVSRMVPIANELDGHKFTTRREGGLMFTRLALVLLIVEVSDVLFAFDSIPAVFAVTRDPLIVFTSNVFAILGLRSLYFALAGLLDKFRYLELSLVFILAFVGVKMVLSTTFHIPTTLSLGIIAMLLALGIGASIIVNRRELRKVVDDALHADDETPH